MLKRLVTITLLLTISFCNSVFGQQTVFGNKKSTANNLNLDEKELKTFTEVYQQLTDLEAQHNLKIIEIVKDHNMELPRYETLSAAERLNMKVDMELGEESTYKSIKEAIHRHKQKTLQEMNQVLIEYQISRKRYSQILQKMRQDSTLRNKVDSLQQEGKTLFK